MKSSPTAENQDTEGQTHIFMCCACSAHSMHIPVHIQNPNPRKYMKTSIPDFGLLGIIFSLKVSLEHFLKERKLDKQFKKDSWLRDDFKDPEQKVVKISLLDHEHLGSPINIDTQN